jgi:hypothetical protein
MAEMYALRLLDMRDWCFEQMNLMNVPYEFSKYVIYDLFAGDSMFPNNLWEYMQDKCRPEPEEDGEESE